MQNRINQLVELNEVRRKTVEKSINNQDKVKKTFDKSSKPRSFQRGDTVLLWDKRREKPGEHGKFDSLWLGPFIIYGFIDTNSFLLNNMDGERLTLLVNGQHLKLFFNEKICAYKGIWCIMIFLNPSFLLILS